MMANNTSKVSENEIDGEAFLELTEAEIITVVPQLGWVKRHNS